MQALCFMLLVTYYTSIIGRGLVTNEQDLQIHLSYFSKELKLMSSLYDEATFSLNFCLQKARGKSHYIHLSSYSVSKFLQFQVKMQMIVVPMAIEYLLESNICQCLVSGYYIINYIYPMVMFPWLQWWDWRCMAIFISTAPYKHRSIFNAVVFPTYTSM